MIKKDIFHIIALGAFRTSDTKSKTFWLAHLLLIYNVVYVCDYLVANGAMETKLKESEDHYTYVNMDQFDYVTDLTFWKPRGSVGDRYID